MSDEWLTHLKVGDEVGVWRSSFGAGFYEWATISKITKTHFIVGSTKYRRNSGRQAGETWHPSWLRQATPELKAEITTERRISYLCHHFKELNWRRLSIETLEEVYNILNSKEPTK